MKKYPLYALVLVLPLVALITTGCQKTKRVFGMQKNPPNEFAVMQRAPLEVPPDFSLRPPRPGAGRPQDKKVKQPHLRAKEVVIKRPRSQTVKVRNRKKKAMRTRHRKGQTVAARNKRQGIERTLIKQARSRTNADPSIRSKVDAEAYQAENKYEKSWLQKKLPFSKSPKDRHVLDARKEAERLKSKKKKS